jgi:putative flippase GtrA
MRQEITSKFLRFCLTGVLGVSISYGIFYALLKFYSLHYLFSSMMGIIIGSIVIFFINRQWTFNQKHGKVNQQKNRFIVLIATCYILNGYCVYFLTESMKIIPELSQVITIGVTTAYNFLLSNFWVFKEAP